MRRLIPFFLLLILVSCSVREAEITKTPVATGTEPAVIGNLKTPTNSPLPTGTFESFAKTPVPEPPTRMNFLLLGQDYREHRRFTGYGDKTDVIVLMSILDTSPVQITLIQYPRNLYLPVEGLKDQWLFGVYANEDTPGLYYYWQEAFDVDLHGVFIINMDGFVKLIDDLGGGGPSELETPWTGEQTLRYLRDNDNNWNQGSYDAEERVFKVLLWMSTRLEKLIAENPIVTAGVLFDRWHGLAYTDIADLNQLAQIARVGWNARNDNWTVRLSQLEEPNIIRGDTPLEVRGMIAVEDLKEWHRKVLEAE